MTCHYLNVGLNKKKGMLIYVRKAMEANHLRLRVEDWTPEMIQNLHDKILAKAMSDITNFN